MSENLATDAKSVKPVRRDRLSHLGDQLDAAQKAGGKAPTRLIREYRAKVRERTLGAPLPKVGAIKTTAQYWEADKMSLAAFNRWRELKVELEAIEFRDDGFTWRQLADLQAAFAVAQRNWLYIHQKINARNVAKKARIKKLSRAKRERKQLASNLGRAIQAQIRRAAP
jgi:hypothetical protein